MADNKLYYGDKRVEYPPSKDDRTFKKAPKVETKASKTDKIFKPKAEGGE